MSETDYQRGWREGAEVMRKALAQAFLEHAGEVGQTIHRRAIWLERAEATKRLAGLRAPDDSAQPPDLAREPRAQPARWLVDIPGTDGVVMRDGVAARKLADGTDGATVRPLYDVPPGLADSPCSAPSGYRLQPICEYDASNVVREADDAQIAELAAKVARLRAQLSAAEQRLARWADAIEGHVLAALLERGEQGDGELWDDVQAYRREQTDEGKNDESR